MSEIKENGNKKGLKIGLGILLAGIILAGGFFGYTTLAEKQKETAAAKDFVAKVNGVGICRTDYEIAKKNVKNNGIAMTDKEVLYKLIVDEALVQEAEKRGFQTTIEEAQSMTNAQKKKTHEGAVYDRLKTYLTELQLSENLYWKRSLLKNQNSSTRNKYKEDLKVTFAKENQIKDAGSLETKFGDYFEQVTSEVMSVADIEVLIPVE